MNALKLKPNEIRVIRDKSVKIRDLRRKVPQNATRAFCVDSCDLHSDSKRIGTT